MCEQLIDSMQLIQTNEREDINNQNNDETNLNKENNENYINLIDMADPEEIFNPT